MTEPKPPPMEDEVRALLQRAARIEAAPAGARARVLARVEAKVGLSGSGGGPSGAPAARLAAARGLGRRLLPLAVSFALGGGAGAWLAMRVIRTPPPTVLSHVVYVNRAVPGQPAPPPSPPAPEPPRVDLVRRPPPAARNPIEVERQLLDVARGALERGKPEAALAAARKHERAFPSGVLVQEREAMAIRALAMLGRHAEAQARADRFHARYPDSVLGPAIAS